MRGGRIGGRHTRRPPRRLTADNGRSGHLVGTEHAVGIRLNEVRGTLVLLILAALAIIVKSMTQLAWIEDSERACIRGESES